MLPKLAKNKDVWLRFYILASAEVFSEPDELISKLSGDAITHSLPLRSHYFKILSNQNRFIYCDTGAIYSPFLSLHDVIHRSARA